MALSTCPFCDSGLAWNNCSCKYAIMAQRRGLIEAKRVFFADGSPRTITKPKPDHTKGVRLMSRKMIEGPIDDQPYREGTKEEVAAALAAEKTNRANKIGGRDPGLEASFGQTKAIVDAIADGVSLGMVSSPDAGANDGVALQSIAHPKGPGIGRGRGRLHKSAIETVEMDVPPHVGNLDKPDELRAEAAERKRQSKPRKAGNDRVAKPAAPAHRRPAKGRVSLGDRPPPRGKSGKRKPPEAPQAEPVGVEPKRPGPAGGEGAAEVVDTPRATRGRRSLLAPRGQCSFCDLRWEADTARMHRHRNKEAVE